MKSAPFALRCFPGAAATVLIAGALSGALAAPEPMLVHVFDAAGEPGGLVAFVLESYSSQSVGQGQICFRSEAKGPETAGDSGVPLGELVGAAVFSSEHDAIYRADLDADQTVMLEFFSESGTINGDYGPMAVIYFRVAPDASPGGVFDISIDTAQSYLLDPDGEPIPIVPMSGKLTIREVGSPLSLRIEAHGTRPGMPALLGVRTETPQRITGGRIALRYPEEIEGGQPDVEANDPLGPVNYRVDATKPGLLLVRFRSPSETFNRVPGQVFSITIPTAADVPPGTEARIDFDPALTYLLGRDGELIPLQLGRDTLRFL